MRAPTHVQLSVSSIRITSAAFQAQQGFLRRALSGNDESVCCVLFRDALDPGNHPPTAENTTGYVRLYPAGPGGGGVGAARGELQGDATAAPSVFDGRWELQGSGMLGGGTSPTTQQASTKNVRRVPRLDASQVVVGVMAASGGELIASTAVIPLADATMAFMLGRPLFLQDGTNVGELEFSLTLFPPLATLSSGGAGGLDFAGAGDLVQQLSDDPPTQHGQPRRLLDIQLNAADDGENDCPICDRGFVPCEYCDEFGYLVCNYCDGRGVFFCDRCQSKGWLQEDCTGLMQPVGGSTSTSIGIGEGEQQRKMAVGLVCRLGREWCEECWGEVKACANCVGLGKARCPQCSGTRKMRCPRCYAVHPGEDLEKMVKSVERRVLGIGRR